MKFRLIRFVGVMLIGSASLSAQQERQAQPAQETQAPGSSAPQQTGQAAGAVSEIGHSVTPPEVSAAPLTASEPATVGELCRLTPAGAPEALERVKVKQKQIGPWRSQGVFKPTVQSYTMYIEGAASSVVFKPGEAQVLAVRLLAPDNRWGRETTLLEVHRHLLMTRLDVQDGRCFITKLDVPFDVRSYGHPTPGLDSEKPDRLAASFQSIPQQPLPPGEYAVLMAGTHKGELVSNMIAGREEFAFGVAGR